MSDSLRKQIFQSMNLKETNELLEIWQTNDRVEWSETAFDLVKEILVQRLGEIPPQGEPVYEYIAEEADNETYSFSDSELRIIDDENPAVFYDPVEVLTTSKRLDWTAKASVIIAVLSAIPGFFQMNEIAHSYFISALLIILGLTLQIVFTYLPLKALSHILKVLMEMEFNSRPRQED